MRAGVGPAGAGAGAVEGVDLDVARHFACETQACQAGQLCEDRVSFVVLFVALKALRLTC